MTTAGVSFSIARVTKRNDADELVSLHINLDGNGYEDNSNGVVRVVLKHHEVNTKEVWEQELEIDLEDLDFLVASLNSAVILRDNGGLKQLFSISKI